MYSKKCALFSPTEWSWRIKPYSRLYHEYFLTRGYKNTRSFLTFSFFLNAYTCLMNLLIQIPWKQTRRTNTNPAKKPLNTLAIASYSPSFICYTHFNMTTTRFDPSRLQRSTKQFSHHLSWQLSACVSAPRNLGRVIGSTYRLHLLFL